VELETALLTKFITDHSSDAARLVEPMASAQSAALLEELAPAVAVALLPRLAPTAAAAAMEQLAPERAAALLSEAPRDAAAVVLRAMRTDRRASVTTSMSPEALRALTPLLRFSAGTAGATMDSGVLSVIDTLCAGEVLDRLRAAPQRALYYVYLVDERQALVGVVNIRQLVEAPPDQPVSLVAVRPVESLPARASSESILAHPGWKRFHALPVVETDGRFLGVIRYKVARQLEERFLETRLGDRAGETASALGELYGLGIRGLFEWGASALLGSDEQSGGGS
jgi:magnesium transporter